MIDRLAKLIQHAHGAGCRDHTLCKRFDLIQAGKQTKVQKQEALGTVRMINSNSKTSTDRQVVSLTSVFGSRRPAYKGETT